VEGLPEEFGSLAGVARSLRELSSHGHQRVAEIAGAMA
jgi:hypothetical protein